MTQFDSGRENGHDGRTDVLDSLEFTEKTGKRAVYESFEFTPHAGYVEVENASHGDESDEHTYRVDVVDGRPVRCSCPADTYHDGACKHRVGLALAEPVIDAATPGGDGVEVATDGGLIEAESDDGAEILDDSPAWDGPFTEYDKYGQPTGHAYVRCPDCGVEVLTGDTGRAYHRPACPHADE